MNELKILNNDYEEKYGFKDPENYVFKTPKGVNEDVVKTISKEKNEPKWMLDFRLKALKIFLSKPMPQWGGELSTIDFDKYTYYIKPSDKAAHSWEDVPDDIKKKKKKR